MSCPFCSLSPALNPCQSCGQHDPDRPYILPEGWTTHITLLVHGPDPYTGDDGITAWWGEDDADCAEGDDQSIGRAEHIASALGLTNRQESENCVKWTRPD